MLIKIIPPQKKTQRTLTQPYLFSLCYSDSFVFSHSLLFTSQIYDAFFGKEASPSGATCSRKEASPRPPPAVFWDPFLACRLQCFGTLSPPHRLQIFLFLVEMPAVYGDPFLARSLQSCLKSRGSLQSSGSSPRPPPAVFWEPLSLAACSLGVAAPRSPPAFFG